MQPSSGAPATAPADGFVLCTPGVLTAGEALPWLLNRAAIDTPCVVTNFPGSSSDNLLKELLNAALPDAKLVKFTRVALTAVSLTFADWSPSVKRGLITGHLPWPAASRVERIFFGIEVPEIQDFPFTRVVCGLWAAADQMVESFRLVLTQQASALRPLRILLDRRHFPWLRVGCTSLQALERLTAVLGRLPAADLASHPWLARLELMSRGEYRAAVLATIAKPSVTRHVGPIANVGPIPESLLVWLSSRASLLHVTRPMRNMATYTNFFFVRCRSAVSADLLTPLGVVTPSDLLWEGRSVVVSPTAPPRPR